MTHRERVLRQIRHEQTDRVALDCWLYREDVNEEIARRWGSKEAFVELLGLDQYTLWAPGPRIIDREPAGGRWTLDELLAAELNDPADESLYADLRAGVEHWGGEMGLCIFAQTGGAFEATNGFLGIEGSLLQLGLNPGKMGEWYLKLMDWYARSIPHVVQCGVDVVHMSDDWGRNYAMMFSPNTWWELVFPADKLVVDAVHAEGLPCSLHSCGYFTDVLDGCVQMGLDVINPIQTSAGMDPWQVKRDFGEKLCIYGGLDIRQILRAASEEDLHAEVKSLMEGLKPGGGYIFCTAHTVQPDTDLDRVVRVYEWAREYGTY